MSRRVLWLVAATVTVLVASTARADNAFYRVLAARPNATVADAVRGFYELTVGPADDVAFEKQTRTLCDMKIIPAAWSGIPQAKLTRGKAAYMICTTCGIKGGVTMRIFGPSERYAFRECVFLGVWDRGSARDYLTGSELLGLIKWSADYLETHPGKGHRPAAAPAAPAAAAPARGDEAVAEPPAPAADTWAPDEEVPGGPIDVKPMVEQMEEMKTTKTPAATPMPGVKGHEYVVQKGDTFANISVRFYGTSRYDGVLMKVNNVSDPWAIEVGQALVIPDDPKSVK